MSAIVPKAKSNTPFPAFEGQFIEGPHGILLYTESHGDPSAQTKIVLIHGAFQSFLCFRQQVEYLVKQGCYVVILDLPWHGFSGPEQRELVPSAELFGASLETVLECFNLLDEPVTLLGWSFGGMVIRNFLLQQRPRNIAGLVFVASVLDFEAFLPIAQRETPQTSGLSLALTASTTPMTKRHFLLQEFVELLWHRPPSISEYYQALGYNFRFFAASQHVLDALVFGMQAPGDIYQTLRELKCPILLIQGQQDQILPAPYTRVLAQTLPEEQVRLLEFPDCGHSPFAEYPADFNRALLDFLAGPVKQFVTRKA